MKEKSGKLSKVRGIIPKIAKALGDTTVDAACAWWYYQPKVPAAMKKNKK